MRASSSSSSVTSFRRPSSVSSRRHYQVSKPGLPCSRNSVSGFMIYLSAVLRHILLLWPSPRSPPLPRLWPSPRSTPPHSFPLPRLWPSPRSPPSPPPFPPPPLPPLGPSPRMLQRRPTRRMLQDVIILIPSFQNNLQKTQTNTKKQEQNRFVYPGRELWH